MRLFLIAGLLLQVAGSPPLNGSGSHKAAATSGKAEVLGFFAASEAATPQPELAASEPPPPLPDAGPYYQTTSPDPITNQVNTNIGGTILTHTTWTLAGSPYLATSSVTVAATFAQVNISHGKLRFSSKAGVRAAANSAAGLVIENSQFVGNTTYGVENADSGASVPAANRRLVVGHQGDKSGAAPFPGVRRQSFALQ